MVNSPVPVTQQRPTLSAPIKASYLQPIKNGPPVLKEGDDPRLGAQQQTSNNSNNNSKENNPFVWGSTFNAPYNYDTPYSFDPNKQAPVTQAWGVASQATGVPVNNFSPLTGANSVQSMTSTGPAYGTGEFAKPTYSLPVTQDNAGQNTQINPYATNALNKMQNYTADDFGLSKPVLEQMKVQQAQGLNKQYDAQAEQTKRLLHSMGLGNDSAMYKAMQENSQNRIGGIADAYSKIDIENAMKANEQSLENQKNLGTFGTQLSQLGEQGRQTDINALLNQNQLGENARQFDVTGLFDQSRLQNDIAKFLETAGFNRSGLLSEQAQFLKNYDLSKLKMQQGLLGENPDLLNQRRQTLPTDFAYGGY